MKILDARVNWNIRFANMPELQVLVDELPNIDDMHFTAYGNLYISMKEGYVLAYHSGEHYTLIKQKNGEYKTVTGFNIDITKGFRGDVGFGSRHIEITMYDGEKRVLCGHWWGNSESQNKLVPWPLQHMECTFCESKRAWDRGYTYSSGFIGLGYAHAAVREFIGPEVEIRLDPWWKAHEREYWSPQRIDHNGEVMPKDTWCHNDAVEALLDFYMRTSELYAFRGDHGIPFENPNQARRRA